jgi:hypothetical protein
LNRRKNGAIFPGWLTITAVQNDRGSVSHYVAVVVDLSKIKQQQATIKRSALEEQSLSKILRMALQPLPMDAFLQQALEAILDSVPWLQLLPGGGFPK